MTGGPQLDLKRDGIQERGIGRASPAVEPDDARVEGGVAARADAN